MHQYNIMGALSERIAINITGPFSLMVVMDYFKELPEINDLPDHEAVTVALVLVSKFFCCFGVPREKHSDQGQNFKSFLLQEVFERLEYKKPGQQRFTLSQVAW